MSDDPVTLKMTEAQLSFLVDVFNRGVEDFEIAARDELNGYTHRDIAAFYKWSQELSDVLASPGEPQRYFVFIQYEETDPDRLFRDTLSEAMELANQIVSEQADGIGVTSVSVQDTKTHEWILEREFES